MADVEVATVTYITITKASPINIYRAWMAATFCKPECTLSTKETDNLIVTLLSRLFHSYSSKIIARLGIDGPYIKKSSEDRNLTMSCSNRWSSWAPTVGVINSLVIWLQLCCNMAFVVPDTFILVRFANSHRFPSAYSSRILYVSMYISEAWELLTLSHSPFAFWTNFRARIQRISKQGWAG